MTVYVVESGDYEQRGIDNVYKTEAAALEGIKADYPEPYVVVWDEPTRDSYSLTIRGHFAEVARYSIKVSKDFFITPWEVKG